MKKLWSKYYLSLDNKTKRIFFVSIRDIGLKRAPNKINNLIGKIIIF